MRVRAETLEAYVGTALAVTLPRLAGKGQMRIDYRHVVWSLVRKPGAFAAYRYREELFPTLLFRRAYDALQERCPTRVDRAPTPKAAVAGAASGGLYHRSRRGDGAGPALGGGDRPHI